MGLAWSFLTSKVGLYLIGAVIAGCFLLRLHHDIYASGRADGRAEFAPVMAACADHLDAHSQKTCATAIAQSATDLAQEKTNNNLLADAVTTANKRVDAFDAAAKRAKAASDAAAKQADDDAVFYTERLKGLANNLKYPSKEPNAKVHCILRALALDRLSGNRSGQTPANCGDEAAGAGAVR